MKAIACVMTAMLLCVLSSAAFGQSAAPGAQVKLPEPKYDGTVSVEKALKERRTVRVYKEAPLSMSDVSQILWAAQGITEHWPGFKDRAIGTRPIFPYSLSFRGECDGVKTRNVPLHSIRPYA